MVSEKKFSAQGRVLIYTGFGPVLMRIGQQKQTKQPAKQI
jgi:hypothetical protein